MSSRRKVVLEYSVEILIYFSLVVVYFFLVLALLADPLFSLFQSDLLFYSVLGLSLLIGQGVLLEFVTSQIVKRIKVR
ncbi:MAG: hypothetical protein ACE5IB_00805 [Candidatus Geothermarchaeales archaeon]